MKLEKQSQIVTSKGPLKRLPSSKSSTSSETISKGKKCKFSPLNHIDHNFKPQESYFMGNINDQLKELNDKMEQHRESVISLAFLELESKVNLVTFPSEMLFNRNRESTLPVNINSSTLSKSFVQI